MKKALLILSLFFSIAAHAQYTTMGKIEYEKKVNVYAQFESLGENDWFNSIKDQLPKFSSTFFDLTFDTAKSIYKPGKEVDNSKLKMFGEAPASDNIVLTDFASKKVKSRKNVFEEHFLVTDTMRKIEWTEKDDIRTIVGFKCHKAVGKICDSVYVVAFYTDDIMASGGPEMFGGLPGMILELAIPRLHTTWTADKFDIAEPAEDFTGFPEKGKKVTEQQLYETLQSSFKDWGKWGSRYIWWTAL